VMTGGGSIRAQASQDVLLSVLDARTASDRSSNGVAGQSAWGGVSVTAEQGSILESASPAKATRIYGSAVRLAAGSSIGRVEGETGGEALSYGYRIEYSTDLVEWKELAVVRSVEEQLSYVDADMLPVMRFYRVVALEAGVQINGLKLAVTRDGMRLSWSRPAAAPAPVVVNPGEQSVQVMAGVLAAEAGNGGMNLVNVGAVKVGDVAVNIQRVTPEGSVGMEERLSGLSTVGGGSLVLRTVSGGLEVNRLVAAEGKGHVHLEAGGTGNDLTARADVRSGSGTIVLKSPARVVFVGTAQAVTAGTISVVSPSGAIIRLENTVSVRALVRVAPMASEGASHRSSVTGMTERGGERNEPGRAGLEQRIALAYVPPVQVAPLLWRDGSSMDRAMTFRWVETKSWIGLGDKEEFPFTRSIPT
jgi:hypothetical protein